MILAGLQGIDGHEIKRRKDRVRRAWRYERVDHVPLGFFLEDLGGHTLREVCGNGALQFERNRHGIDRLLRLLPDDYIPVARVWPGYMTIATMFGLPVHWSDNPNQAPGVREHPITDMAQVRALKAPDPVSSGLMPFNLEWLRHFAAQFPPEVSLTGIDLGGPLNTAKDLLDTNLLFTAFYDSPAEFHQLLALAADVQMGCLRAIVEAAGGLDRLTCVDFDPLWAPEGAKGFVSDDVCAGISPELFREFSLPYNSRVFRAWPGGRIHNCGPHPAADLYLHHDPPIHGLNASFKYTRASLPRIREAFRGRGILEIMFDNGERSDDILRGYREVAEELAPDVVAMPLVWLNESWTDDEIRALHIDLGRIAGEYARNIRWRGKGRSSPEE